MATISQKEQVIDRVSKLLIQSFSELGVSVDISNVSDAQHRIETSGPNRGKVVKGRQSDEKLALFKSDYLAYKQEIESELSSNDSIFDENQDIEKIVFEPPNRLRWWDESNTNYSMILSQEFLDNIGQFIDFTETSINIDPTKAKDVIQDKNVYELLPTQQTRADRISNFFSEFNTLIGNAPTFPDTTPPDGYIDQSWFDSEEDIYQHSHDLNQQDNWTNLLSDAGYFIPRLNIDSDALPSIENMRDTLNAYLEDIDEVIPTVQDERPEYENVSPGYLKIRNLNQAIIIRNQEKDDVGLIGPNPNNPLWRTAGFTITMWVKFLDKVNKGTLFNFGNPLREDNPYGFMLETYVVKKTETSYMTPGYWDDNEGNPNYLPNWGFTDSDTERFIRLVVRDGDGKIRDSHVPIPSSELLGSTSLVRRDTATLEKTALDHGQGYAWTYTRVPVDLQEWYFIVATYSPLDGSNGIDEDTSILTYMNDDDLAPDGLTLKNSPEFWRWNVTPLNAGTGTYSSNSGYGAQCKVEIISKTDLLRARGYKS